jgi:hypothetical protein
MYTECFNIKKHLILHTKWIMRFRWFSQQTGIISLNCVYKFASTIEKRRVPSEMGTDFLNILYENFMLQSFTKRCAKWVSHKHFSTAYFVKSYATLP